VPLNEQLVPPAYLPGVYLLSQLPAASGFPFGTQANTTTGPVYSNGTVWLAGSLVLATTSQLIKRPFVAPGAKNVQQVMSSPPTAAIVTTNPFTSGQFYGATNQTTQQPTAPYSTSHFSVTRSGNPLINAAGLFPNQQYINFNSVTSGLGGSNYYQVSTQFSGTVVGIGVKGVTGSIYAKVADQYVSLTPTAIGTTGVINYYSLTFGAAVIDQRVDFIVSNIFGGAPFQGVYTGALTDTILPAEIRGPRVIIIGDSLTTATGAGGQAQGYVQVFSEYLGWDDVWASGIGGTGLIATGSYVNYQSRITTDAIAFAPDEIIIAGFQNDTGSTVAAMTAALLNIITTIQAALPLCRITIFGPYSPYGLGYQSGNNSQSGTGYIGTRTAIAAALATVNSPLVRGIDLTNQPLLSTSTLPAQQVFTTTLTSSPAANATTFTTAIPLISGQNYVFPDGSRCRVLSVSGTTATVDRVQNAQTSGSVVTQAGSCYITGNGFSGGTTGVGNGDLTVYTDHIHLTNQGHFQMGCALAQAYAQNLNTL
jgi:lysophospholipase L1-like esterase